MRTIILIFVLIFSLLPVQSEYFEEIRSFPKSYVSESRIVNVNNTFLLMTYNNFLKFNNEKWQKNDFIKEFPLLSYIYKLYAINDTIYAFTRNDLCISTDEGESWHRKYDVTKEIITFSKDNSNIVIRDLNSIYFSTNDGASWISRKLSESDTLSRSKSSLLMHNNALYIAHYKSLYKSYDFGNTLIKLGDFNRFKNGFREVSIKVLDNTFFIHYDKMDTSMIFYSIDEGKTWEQILLEGFKPLDIQFNGEKYFMSTLEGYLFESSDLKNWRRFEEEFMKEGSSIVFTVNKNKIFVISPPYGLFFSSDNGKNWIKSDYSPGGASHFVDVGEDLLFLRPYNGGVYRFNTNTDNFTIQKVHYFREDKSFDQMVAEDSIVVLNGVGYLSISYDKGKTFNYPPASLGYLAVWVNDLKLYRKKLYICNTRYGFFISDDLGNEVTKIDISKNNCALTSYVSDSLIIVSFYKEGIFYSVDNGMNWVNRITGLKENIRVIDVHNNIWFAGFGGRYNNINENMKGLYLSYDSGDTWINVPDFSEYVVTNIYRYKDIIFVSTIEKGVFFTTDFGQTWKNIGFKDQTLYSIYDLKIYDLIVKNGYLYAGGNNGFFRAKLSEFLSINDSENQNKLSLSFPNPVTEKLTLINIPDNATEFEIYDQFGNRQISGLISGQIDVSLLTAGVYFLKLNNSQRPLKFLKI